MRQKTDMNSIVEYVAYYAENAPDHCCVIDNTGAYDYCTVWRNVCRYAKLLDEIGVRKEDPILVECTQDVRFVLENLSCELIGAVFVPFARRMSSEKVSELMKETQAKFIISETVYNNSDDSAIPIVTICLEKKESVNISESDFEFPMKEQLAEILFTTGTTGKSKGIEMTHGANVALAENIRYGVNIKPENVELIPLPLNHSHGIRCVYANLISGTAIVITDGVTKMGDILNALSQYKVTAMDISPSAALIMEKLSKGRLADYRDQIRYIQIGTASLQQKEKEFLKQMFPSANLYNFYGCTESGRTCVIDFNFDDHGDKCIGRSTKNTVVRVADNKGKFFSDSSAENPGFLAFSGSMNMKGYHKQPELTKEVLIDGYVYTNDIGYVDSEGYVYLIGRQGDIINYGGIKISPDEVENAAISTGMISECACVPIPDPVNGQAPKLFIVVKEENRFLMEEFQSALNRILDREKIPKTITLIDRIPRSENGKILRRMLSERSD